MRIDISIFKKEDVLVALYNQSKKVGLGELQVDIELTKDEAIKIIDRDPYIDYLNGKLIKVMLDSDLLDVSNYDDQYGDGHAFKVLRNLELELQNKN